MAKLYFRYSAMNSGKTTALIQAAFNYEERGMRVVVLKPKIDTKGDDQVVSRLGTSRKADVLLDQDQEIGGLAALDSIASEQPIRCVLVDEAQFLTPDQVDDLFWFAVNSGVPVMAYGLRTDFQMKGFPGATRLLEVAHEIQELKTICRCGSKAMLNGRKRNGAFISEGEQVAIDGEAAIDYESLCGKCYQELVLNKS